MSPVCPAFLPTTSQPTLFPISPFSSFPRTYAGAIPKSVVRLPNQSPPRKLISSRPGVLISDDRKAWTTSPTPDTAAMEAEPKDEGQRANPMTKLVCTIGPETCSPDQIEALAAAGMKVARINMCHGTREWHRAVIERVRKLNEEKGVAVAVLMDTEGSEIHMGDLGGAISTKADDGDMWTFTVRALDCPPSERTVHVNYDGFAEDVKEGDELVVDGGMVRFEVFQKIGPDVLCRCIDPGILLPRANLTFWRNGSLVQERNAMLPTLSSKDWLDIDFGIEEGVDFIGVSFVKSAEVINHLKSYIAARCRENEIAVIAKIESIESLKNLEEIVQASNGVMVARGDLGAQIPLERVPSVQKRIIEVCRQLNRPVIVASQLLESMIEYPIPTRAEVADVSEAVGQQADALMLSGESAMGNYPEKALAVLRTVSLRIERHLKERKHCDTIELPAITSSLTRDISEEICNAAANMANKLEADFIFVYTKSGRMPSLLSRFRPDCPIFAFTPSTSVEKWLNLQWGVTPFRLSLSDDMEHNLSRTFPLLKAKGMLQDGDLVIVVSDMLQSVQVLTVP